MTKMYQASNASQQLDDVAKTPGRRRKRRGAASGSSKGVLSKMSFVRQVKRLYQFLLRRLSSGFMLSLPFALLILITATDFLILATQGAVSNSVFFDDLGGRAYAVGREEAEAAKSKLQSFVYLGVFFLTAVHWRPVLAYAKRWRHIILLVAALLITATYSIDPIKVVTNSIIIAVGVLASVLLALANGRESRYHVFYLCVLLPMLLVHIGSILIFLQQGQNLIDFLSSGLRFGGLAGNPNSLGATAVLGCWAALCVLFNDYVGRGMKILSIASIALFALHIAMSGSGTAFLSVSLMAIVFFWMRTISTLKSVTRAKINIGVVFGVACLLMAVLVVSSPAELFVSAAEGLGKDSTMTGRTDVWAIAKEAISDRPFFGWGYDSHASVFATPGYEIEFNHYHNGFLDTLIAGGVFLLAIVLYHLGRFLLAFRMIFLKTPAVFPLFVPFFMLLLLNLSEYSLLRPNSQVWAIYFASFVILTFNAGNSTSFDQAAQPEKVKATRSKKRRGRSLRW